jgi:hypothetical protein
MEIAHFSAPRRPGLKLVFAEAGPGPTLQVGPYDAVRIDGENLRSDRDGVPFARHEAHTWLVQGRKFFRIDCEIPVRLHFEDEGGKTSEVYGPFLHFSCADGIVYGDGMIYANIDLETKRWYSHRDKRYWSDLVVTSAAAPPS